MIESSDPLLAIALALNALEDPFAFALLVAGCTILISLRNPGNGLAFFLTIGLTFASIHIAKSLFDVARPIDALADTRGSRFPSMHAGIGAALIGSVTWYLLQELHSPIHRALLIAFASILIFIVAWTRIILHVHLPVDVIVGTLIGGMVTLTLHAALEKMRGYDIAKPLVK